MKNNVSKPLKHVSLNVSLKSPGEANLIKCSFLLDQLVERGNRESHKKSESKLKMAYELLAKKASIFAQT